MKCTRYTEEMFFIRSLGLLFLGCCGSVFCLVFACFCVLSCPPGAFFCWIVWLWCASGSLVHLTADWPGSCFALCWLFLYLCLSLVPSLLPFAFLLLLWLLLRLLFPPLCLLVGLCLDSSVVCSLPLCPFRHCDFFCFGTCRLIR